MTHNRSVDMTARRTNASDQLERGREAYRRRRWGEALTLLSAAQATSPLDPADYQAMVTAEWLTRADVGALTIWERAHREFLTRGDIPRAAMSAFSLGMGLLNRGEAAQGGGWIARANRLLDEANYDGPGRGYLLIPSAIQAMQAGDMATALEIYKEASSIGKRFGDQDLVTLARHGEGRTRLRGGDVATGLRIMDEVMVAVTSGEVSPIVVGIVYCSVIEALREVYDIGRAREWTAALERWCESQPDLVLFRGECMVHRAEVLKITGDWPAALDESEKACARFLGPPPHPAAGSAFYQEGELHRLAGRFPAAEKAYIKSGELGRNPQPGLALLRLAQGRLQDAEASIRRVLSETRDPMVRAGILPAFVEIMLAANDHDAARAASSELEQIAVKMGSAYLGGTAAQASGATHLAAGEPVLALAELRTAAAIWQRLEATHHAAQVRLLIGLACRYLGDDDAAGMEIEAARQAFQHLGAIPDLDRLRELVPSQPRAAGGGLTGREVQLLGLLATGKTNREIANALVISEKTVARHVSNIFNKLGVSSRAAATAYAFKHDLV